MTSDDPLGAAAQWLDEGRAVALATVVETWGSSPRREGSKLAIAEDGRFVGSVSGGCVETAVVDEAAEVLGGGPPKLLEYGVTDERAWEVGLACGGRVVVFLDRADRATLTELERLRAAHRIGVMLTAVPEGTRRIVSETALDDLEPTLRDAAEGAIASDAARTVEVDGSRWLVDPVVPPPRLVIVGAVHIAQKLAAMASLVDFEVVVVDPRTAFANDERFPTVTLRTGWPDEELEALSLDRRTAVVTLTHDPKLDDPALQAALRSPSFYVGALGSRKTQAARLLRLEEAGFDETARSRIAGPVGLPIGARTPAEIATAILAQIVQTLRGAS